MCYLDDWADNGSFRNTIDDPKLDEKMLRKNLLKLIIDHQILSKRDLQNKNYSQDSWKLWEQAQKK